jgi:peptidoglycan/xylan/chitin deacetylase (PgdA/CDA1 family)
MLTERLTGWWDTIAFILKAAPSGQYVVDVAGNALQLDLTSRARVTHSIRSVLGAVKQASQVSHHELQSQICAVTGGRLPSDSEQSSQIMTAEHVKELVRCGMAVGGHSHTHQILAQLPEQSQRAELTISKEILEATTGEPVVALAYPVGGQGHYTTETCRYAREAGYLCAFNFRPPGGFANLSHVDLFDIPRIGASPLAGALFRAQISGIDWEQARKLAPGIG